MLNVVGGHFMCAKWYHARAHSVCTHAQRRKRANDTDTAKNYSVKRSPYAVWPHICDAN